MLSPSLRSVERCLRDDALEKTERLLLPLMDDEDELEASSIVGTS